MWMVPPLVWVYQAMNIGTFEKYALSSAAVSVLVSALFRNDHAALGVQIVWGQHSSVNVGSLIFDHISMSSWSRRNAFL
jgi:hypothetical protein